MRDTMVGLAVLALLTGCASLPTGKISGALKPGGFAFADAGSAQPVGLQDLVSRRLVGGGLKPASAADADYMVYVGFSALPVKAGVYMPDAKTPQAAPADWAVNPQKGKKLHLEVVVLERASGARVFDGAATLTGPGRHDKAALPDLVDAAFSVGAKP